ELLDFTGRWCRERGPVRRPFQLGAWTRENRRGRTAADSAYVTVAGTPDFAHRRGAVWATHLAWSGDQVTWAEAQVDGVRVLGAAELLAPGELTLSPGGTYLTPTVLAAYSGVGLDGISDRFHRHLRARPTHPSTPRPAVLNTWEAVYFDQNLADLSTLADVAAAAGLERFVLDDGWFGGRRDDTTSLGDWTVSGDVWPDGLTPLIDHVTGLGLEFGLWVEPEMINADSDLHRAHPDWVLGPAGRLGPEARQQHVLDLANPEAWQYLYDALHALLVADDIGYLKWDHNRDLIAATHDGRAGVHVQTLAVYRLFDALKAAHPGLEIESCASGGARVDLGVLARTDRVWASDCNDALERQQIQRWTNLLLPLELIGTHVGPPTAHTTGRTHGLSFRAATALFGHFGVEWDIVSATDADRVGVATTAAAYKRLRDLLHTGTAVHADHPDPAATLSGVVATDRSAAVFAYVQLTSGLTEAPVPARFVGLDPQRRYTVTVLEVAGPVGDTQRIAPGWIAAGGITASGRVLESVGLELPILQPEQALVMELHAT
ncbi:MAG: alpha-galactosidase, partial [Nakamurella sp.]